MKVQVDPSVERQLAPLKSWRTQPTATSPAGPAVTPVISVSIAGWQGAQPRVITTPGLGGHEAVGLLDVRGPDPGRWVDARGRGAG